MRRKETTSTRVEITDEIDGFNFVAYGDKDGIRNVSMTKDLTSGIHLSYADSKALYRFLTALYAMDDKVVEK